MTELHAPQFVAPAGEHSHTELLFRVTTRDGRITDHGPYVTSVSANLASLGITLGRPPGSTLTKLTRTVTTAATDWTPVEQAAGERAGDDRTPA